MPSPTAFQNLGTTDEAAVVKDVLRLDNSPGGVLLPSRGWALQGWVAKALDASGLLTWNGERSIQVLGFEDSASDALETILNNFDPTDGQLLTLVTDLTSEIDVRDLGVIGSGSKRVLMRGENAHCLLDDLRTQLHLRWDQDADQWREQSRSQSVKRRQWLAKEALTPVGAVLTALVGTTPLVAAFGFTTTAHGVVGRFTRPPDYADATAVKVGVALALRIAETANDNIQMELDYLTVLIANATRDINHTSTNVTRDVDIVSVITADAYFEVDFTVPVSDANNPLTTWDIIIAEARLRVGSQVAEVNVLGMFLEYSPVI